MNLNADDTVMKITPVKVTLKDIAGVAVDLSEFDIDGRTAKPKKRKAHPTKRTKTKVKRKYPHGRSVEQQVRDQSA